MTALPPAHKPRGNLGTLARFLKLWWKHDSFFHSTGLKRSYAENRPVDAAGDPLPWFNYALIHLLDERLTPEHRVFEYGSGYSTLWFARRAAYVESVEHNAEWRGILEPSLPTNARLRACEPGIQYQQAAERSANEQGAFDLVLVDGLDRELCLPYAARALTSGGVIVLDDSHRTVYRAALDELQTLGFRELRWFGVKPNSLIEAQTLLLYREHNVLGI